MGRVVSGETQCQIKKRRQLCSERFCGGHANFGTGLSQIDQLTCPHHRAVINIADRQPRQHARAVDVLKRRECVCRFTRLGDTHNQRIGKGHRIAVAKL